jgi:hypothetical protein
MCVEGILLKAQFDLTVWLVARLRRKFTSNVKDLINCLFGIAHPVPFDKNQRVKFKQLGIGSSLDRVLRCALRVRGNVVLFCGNSG